MMMIKNKVGTLGRKKKAAEVQRVEVKIFENTKFEEGKFEKNLGYKYKEK